MRYSNNFIANQIFLAVGAAHRGAPATMEKSVEAVTRYLEGILGIKGLTIVEGSGISRENRLSAFQLFQLLHAFTPHGHLLRKGDHELYKTGTLNGIRTRAGYLLDRDNNLYPYAILINTPGKSTGPILEQLKRWVRHHHKN
jgi:D-alanyl-D-alanine carboxypeptidase/D-alanyl-D-alanine-endopeptidase (penicillin-binding protein 4)